jgi:hypothetical protein
MYPQIPWELFADPLGSAEHILGTTGMDYTLVYVVCAFSWFSKRKQVD